MSVSIYDLAREAELLKSNMSRQQSATSPPTEVWSCRQRLEDIYRQIILLDLGLALEKRVEADLWTFVFRTQIDSLLSDVDHQQGDQQEETQATLSLFLESVSCFYYQLLHSICHKHRVSLPNFLSAEQIGVSRVEAGRRELAESVRVICQDCLLRMGNVARYKGECALATKYYYQADELLPGRGHISNQLGLVASAEGNFFAAAFHFSHAITSSSFPAQTSDLDQILRTHARSFPEEMTDRDSFQTGFLHLLSLLSFSGDLSLFCFHLPHLHAPLSSLLQAGDASHEFMLSLVGLCLFACSSSLQPLAGTPIAQAAECLNSEEHQKYQLSLQLLLEITSVLTSASLSLPRPQLSSLLPFISTGLHWVQLNLCYIATDQLSQLPSLWRNLARLMDKLCLKQGFERCIDTTQRLTVELSLFGFLYTQEQSLNTSTYITCTIEELCLGKIVSAIRSIIKEKLSTLLSLTTTNGVYRLSFTPPVLPQDDRSPELSPVFSPLNSHTPPLSNSSTDYTFFPSIWSNNPDEQTSPEMALPSVASADNIKSLWNVSDIASP